jgi:4-amino-4-deoxy-L-arabinose transferase-like glycosyltransferase
VVASWVASLLCWLWDITAESAPRFLCQSVVLIGVAATVAALVWVSLALWRAREEASRWSWGRVLLLLVVVALAVHWIGVDWEVTGRYYRDEGIYYAAANDINEGELFPESFIYGHLPYYIYAFALWVQSLFAAPLAWIFGGLFGVSKEVDVSWIILRGINTTLGALTTVPVFLIGRRVAGLGAAFLASMLIIFSPIYNEITRLLISDVPSAFFAAVCLGFVAMLLDEERLGPYLGAGVAAALAAASKFPAGVVVVSIIGIWLTWRIRKRNWSWGLVAAGLVSFGTFLAVMPAFLVHSDAVFVGQGKDLLFGFRQYGRGGWIGVMPSSNAAWYGQQVLASFGLPALILGLLGWPLLERESRRRFLWMLPFPVVFMSLLISMSMVVKRNLLPALPALAAVLGIGVCGWLQVGQRRLSAFRRGWLGLLMGAVLILPVYRTVLQTIGYAQSSTREDAAAWIDEHVPRGATIIKESYTPHLHKKKYTVHQTRFVPRVPLDEIRSGQWDYVLLARNAYGRFLDPQNWEKPHHEFFAQSYEVMLQFDRVQEFAPGRIRMGPSLELYKADPEVVDYLDDYRYAFEGEGFRYPRDDAYLLLKEYMAPGSFDVRIETEPVAPDGRVEVVTRDGRDSHQIDIEQGRGVLDLAHEAKYFFYIYLPKDTEITAFELTRR